MTKHTCVEVVYTSIGLGKRVTLPEYFRESAKVTARWLRSLPSVVPGSVRIRPSACDRCAGRTSACVYSGARARIEEGAGPC